MFDKRSFREYLRFSKKYNAEKFEVIVGKRKSFDIHDVTPALRELAKDYPVQLPKNEFIKSER